MNCDEVMIDEATQRFVAEHADGDVRQLALQASRWPDVDMALALDQIVGRQAALRKLPRWAATPGIVYPPHLALEQCSSEMTADYKASLLPPSGGTLVDLTGGLGVDCAAMAPRFERVTYVERQEQLCRLARHNFVQLGLNHVEVVNADSVDYLHTMPLVDVIFLDPARRDTAGRRTYAISDCSPDVAQLASELLEKAPLVMVKLSPMLDVSQTLSVLPSVSDVHIVSKGGECKELLLMLRHGATSPVTLHCVDDGEEFIVERGSAVLPAPVWDGQWHEGLCLYEPNPSMMKAGCFDHVATHYGLSVVSRDSHLMVGRPLTAFQGRVFEVVTVTTMNKRELRRALEGIEKANVAVRNFPLSAAELSRRLHVRDGGQYYIFATTTAQGKHVLFVTVKR